MATSLPHEFRKFMRSSQLLSRILSETSRSLKEIDDAGFFQGEEVEQELLEVGTTHQLEQLSRFLEGRPVLVVLGQSCKSRAQFVNALLETNLLPISGGDWRWSRILYGRVGHVALTVGLEFEVVEKLQAHEKPLSTVPEEDLIRPAGEDMAVEHLAVVEVQVCHPVVRDGSTILVVPNLDYSQSDERASLSHMLQCDSVLPVLIYVMDKPSLSQKDVAELHELKQLAPDSPIFFTMTSPNISSSNSAAASDPTMELTESEQHELEHEHQQSNGASQNQEVKTKIEGRPWRRDSEIQNLAQQLENLGFLSPDEACGPTPKSGVRGERYVRKSCLSTGSDQLLGLNQFARGVLRSHLVTVAMHLNQVHCAILRRFILCAFDKAREIQITPRRMRYALEKETELYRALVAMASEKQAEVTDLIENTLETMQSELIEEAAQYQYRGGSLSAAGESGPEGTPRAVRLAATEIQQLVLSRLSHAVARRLVCSMDCLQDSVVGTLLRTLCSLERTDRAELGDVAEPDLFVSQDSKEASESWDLSSCTESQGLVVSNNQGPQLASDALKQILSAAYSVQLSTSTSSSLLHGFMERLRQLLYSVQLPWSAPPRLDAVWRRRVALEMLENLSPQRLAKSISSQFRERVRLSHEAFLAALRSLANHYTGHLEKTEEQRVAIRGHHAPRLARLALETTSIADMVRYGMPQLGKEIGRGQYGVVFSCESWGGTGPCAVKSVVPPDEKHWNDLAMEFYYTRTVPEHPRIVKLRGSVVDHSYGGGCSPAVLLVMDRLTRDLYSGLRSGLPWKTRLQIAIDVAEGIRYLHSQGLVHRDVKLKNVLLDCDNRAKLTDLGFCIPEAMMSGSIVGTPVHMAPEMHSGHYDSSVDVYAFGILLWYICAGSVKLPAAFEQFHNKEQLWTSVRKGIRPEQLAHFDQDCWQLMEECWSGDPAARPLLGYVQPQLEKIAERFCHQNGHDHPTVEDEAPSTSQVNANVRAFPFPPPAEAPAAPIPVPLPIPSSTDFWHHVREV
ncbi:hypothetical protein FOCC_FOCC000786 [Frankliniella occidentalis]|uniref:Dual serine/threonine and tyrosine protein kinase n=1 Tax=Frankliniella occidentalis TaxID=133901 RepID=A0A6J1S8E9_FRAOC|nr:dual serine/threonine and tyrosine protein kinase [Frankliniella occidentalis]XP_026274996.1 dual serine/threonine and tyrosine protein kinase [Frankliniella occidentalis]KAE8752664.1 hypothetical protein FOCC_FOCC000786 [Frankliniella occidentalis]